MVLIILANLYYAVIPCQTRNPVSFSNTCQLSSFSIAYQFFLIKSLDTDFRRYDEIVRINLK